MIRRPPRSTLFPYTTPSDLSTYSSVASFEKLHVLEIAESVHSWNAPIPRFPRDRKSTRLNSSHVRISYAVFCLKKKTEQARYRDERRHAQRGRPGIYEIRNC